MKENSSRKFKRLIPVLSVMPFVIGAIGYFLAGEKVSDALYYSFSLYFVNLNSDAYNVVIEIARWMAALVMAAAVLYVLKQLWVKVCRWFRCCRRDSVAVYSDTDLSIVFQKENHPVIYPGRNLCPAAKSQVIMLGTDTDSLRFYEENKESLKRRNIYIGLKEIEYGLMKDAPNVTFYDIDGAIARTLWKSIRLWKQNRYELTVTILGTGHLGQSILSYGLLLNLFSLHQRLSYRFIGNNFLYRAAHAGFMTCNNDSVLYDLMDDAVWDIIKQSDLVIISERVPIEKLQAIGVLCRNNPVYYYAPQKGNPGEYLNLSNLIPFGRDNDIYTDENIRAGKLTRQAMDLNYEYIKKFGNGTYDTDVKKEWNKLNGFLKWSNISQADFKEVLAELDASMQNEELAELEHIRWCRFHYLNYWTYGVPDNGKNKDEQKRIHKDLVAYQDLEDEEKDKDRAVIDAVRKNQRK